MKQTRIAVTQIAASVLVALSLCAAPAFAADPEEHFLLTPALLQKIKAAGPELKKLEGLKDEEDGDNDPSIDELVKKIESEPRARAVLARHGIGTREFALSTYALLHAGMYVTLAPSMDKKQAAEMMNTFTKEQKANIALLRKLGPAAYTPAK